MNPFVYVAMTPTQRPWTASQMIRGSVSNRLPGTAKSAHVGIDIRTTPPRVVTRTISFVVWTTSLGLTATHGSGGSHEHAWAWVIPANWVAITGAG